MKRTEHETSMNGELAESLVFDAEGHLADLGVSIFADAEFSLLPASAILHGETCEACAMRIGNLALLSMSVGADIRHAAQGAATTQARFPAWAVGLAAAVSAAFALPLFGQLVSNAHAQGRELAHSAPLALRSLQSSLQASGFLFVCISLLALATCTFIGRRLLVRASA